MYFMILVSDSVQLFILFDRSTCRWQISCLHNDKATYTVLQTLIHVHVHDIWVNLIVFVTHGFIIYILRLCFMLYRLMDGYC